MSRDLNRDWALRYAETGISVFPCAADNKCPLKVPADQMAQRQRYECRLHRRNVEPVARLTGRHRPA
jgi:hypothetical protein